MSELTAAMGACVIVANGEGKILFGKRKGGYKAGTYGLPGGRVESNEPLLDTARRELEEETGLVAHDMKYFGVVREWQETNSFIHFVYVCTNYSGDVENKEPEKCEGWEWFSLDALPEPLLPGNVPALEMYQTGDSSVRDIV
jgi:8-oxo-dGTP diphosphatase